VEHTLEFSNNSRRSSKIALETFNITTMGVPFETPTRGGIWGGLIQVIVYHKFD
jgi:hypothetical protein